jgi:hypothetical protein
MNILNWKSWQSPVCLLALGALVSCGIDDAVDTAASSQPLEGQSGLLDDDDSTKHQSSVLTVDEFDEGAAVDAFAETIHWETEITTAAAAPNEFKRPIPYRFEPYSFLSNLDSLLPDPVGELVLQDGRFEPATESSNQIVRVDATNERFVIRSAAGSVADNISALRATDEDLKARTLSFMDALGAEPSEMSLDVRDLTRSYRDTSGANPTIHSEVFARKVFVDRNVRGIPIVEDGVVLTYTVDGRFKKMIGRWQSVDYDSSRLGTSLTDAAVLDRGIQALVAQKLQPTLHHAPSVRLAYFRELTHPDRLVLRGEVALAPKNDGKVRSILFDVSAE